MYKYEEQKKEIKQKDLIEIGHKALTLIDRHGSFEMDEVCGCSWPEMACVDLMVELGIIREVSTKGCLGQRREFRR